MRRLLTIGALLAAGCGCGSAAEPAPIPVEDFFGTPALVSPRLSDDGARVLMLIRGANGKRSIATFDFATNTAKLVFSPEDYDVDYAFWKGERIVFGGDVGGNESSAMRSIKADGSDLVDLSESYQEYRPLRGAVGAAVASRLRDDPHHVIVLGVGAEKDLRGAIVPAGEFGVYRLDVRTGKRRLLEVWGDKHMGIAIDAPTGVVYGRARQVGGETIFEVRAPGSRRFVEAGRENAGEDGAIQAFGLLPGGTKALILRREAGPYDRGALIEYDLATGQPGAVRFEPPAGEIDDVVLDDRGALVGVRYSDAYPHYHWFDQKWAKLHASLSATFPGEFVEIGSRDRKETRFIIVVHSDRNPGAYYLFDAEKTSLTPLGKILPKIDPAQMAPRRPFAFKARDGLKIQGYLTIPVGREKQPNPLIQLPHGGPFGIRDDWMFDAEAQFLASRGYTVMQVNYRGSGGYGAAFQAAGKRKWGREMQDDLTDAVDWAIAQKLTTPEKVAIVGASYGGYAALAGLVYTPEKYCLGVNNVGVSDLRLIVDPKTKDRGRMKPWYAEWVGTDGDDLKARSPVEFVERIRVPTLHAYGDNDPRVDIEHWRLLERELKRHNKPYFIIREKDQGHGFENEDSRLQYYRALEEFLGLGFAGRLLSGEHRVLKRAGGAARESDR